MKRLIKKILLVIFGAMVYLYLCTTPLGIEPVSIQTGPLNSIHDIPNLDLDRLKNARQIIFPESFIEDVAVDKAGNIYVFAGSGPSSVYKVSPSNYSIYVKIAETSGRVVGTCLSKSQKLLAFADQKQGAKILNLQTFQSVVVASQYQGFKFKAINSLAFDDQQKTLYFTQPNDITLNTYYHQILYRLGRGSVYSVQLSSKKISIIASNLNYPNGLAYSSSEKSLFVNELSQYKISKINLQTKTKSTLISDLVGTPDNLKFTNDGKLWVAVPMTRNFWSDFINKNAWLRKIIINSKIKDETLMKLAFSELAGGIKIDPKTGQIMDYFFGKTDKIDFVTGIVERNGKLHLVSLKHNKVVIVDYL